MGADGTLQFDTSLDTSGFAKGISQVTGISQKTYESTTKTFLGISGVIAGIGTAAVKTTADFDAEMSKVSAISGATGDDFDSLRDKAREMGSKTKFSASESAEALEYMAMAGWKTEDMLNGIEGVMNLAAASGEDLGTTSDIVTDAMTAFGLSAKDSGHFADILASASSNANTNVSMLGESFKYVAPVAGSMGMSAEDVSVALGMMANSGIKASQAGTSLRGMLTNMAKPSKEAKEAMEKLGISLDDGHGHMKSLRQIMDELRSGFGDLKISDEDFTSSMEHLNSELEAGTLTQEDYEEKVAELTERAFGAEGALKAQAAAALAGKTGMSGLLAIVNASDEDYQKLISSIENCTYQVDDISGALEKSGIDWTKWSENGRDSGEVIKSMVDDVIYGIDNMKMSESEVLEYLMEAYGMTAEEASTAFGIIKEGMDSSTGAAQNMADVMQDNLNGQITILMSALQELAISIGEILIPYVTKAVEIIQGWVDKFNSLDEGTKEIIVKIGAFVATVGPVLLIAAKVVSVFLKLKAAFAAISTTITAVKAGFAAVGVAAALPAAPILIVIGIITALVAAFAYLWTHCEGFREFWIGLWEKIKEAASTAWEGIKGFFTAVGEFIRSIPEKLSEFVSGLWETVTGFFAQIGEAIVGFFTSIPEKVVEFFTTVVTTIGEWFETIRSAVGQFFEELPYKLGYMIGLLIGNIIQFGIDVFEWVTTTIPEIINSIVEFFTELPGKIWEWLCDTVEKIKEWGSECLDWIKENVPEIIESVVDFFRELPGKIWEWLTETVGKIKEWGQDAIANASEAAKETIDKVVEFFSELPGKIWEWLSGTIDKVAEFGGDLVNKGIEAASDFVNNMIETVSGLPDEMVTIGYNIVTGIWNGICEASNWFWNSVMGFFSGIVDGVKGSLGINSPSRVFAKEVGQWIPPGAGEGIERAMPALIKSAKKEMTSLVDAMQTTVDVESSKLSFDKVGEQGYESARLERKIGRAHV